LALLRISKVLGGCQSGAHLHPHQATDRQHPVFQVAFQGRAMLLQTSARLVVAPEKGQGVTFAFEELK